MKMTKVPNLLKQETIGYNTRLSSYISLISKDTTDKELKEELYEKYKSYIYNIFLEYL